MKEEKVALVDGQKYDFEAIVNLMDNEIREKVYTELDIPCSPQEFVKAYAEKHMKKFKREFKIN